MLFICYPKCTTCQKAQKWLDAHEIKHDIRHIKDENPSEDEQYKLLASDGMLVKRPIIIADDFITTGFKEKEWEENLL